MNQKKYTLKDIKTSSNYRYIRVKCKNAVERTALIDTFLSVGIQWHGERKYTNGMMVENEFPWREYDTVELTVDGLYMQGNRSRYLDNAITYQSFMEALNE